MVVMDTVHALDNAIMRHSVIEVAIPVIDPVCMIAVVESKSCYSATPEVPSAIKGAQSNVGITIIIA